MIVSFAASAKRQIDALSDHYLSSDRPEAALKLEGAVQRAVDMLMRPELEGRAFPGPYREVASLGISWLDVAPYWFGFVSTGEGERVITNVIWNRADIPARIDRQRRAR